MTGGKAYRVYLDDSAWQGYVADKIRRADAIVLLIKQHRRRPLGTYENHCRGHGCEDPVSLFHRGQGPGGPPLLCGVDPAAANGGGSTRPVPSRSRAGRSLYFTEPSVEIVNAHWTATSDPQNPLAFPRSARLPPGLRGRGGLAVTARSAASFRQSSWVSLRCSPPTCRSKTAARAPASPGQPSSNNLWKRRGLDNVRELTSHP